MEIYRILITLFSTFLSLLGVFVVFRLNTLHNSVKEYFENLKAATKTLNKSNGERYRFARYLHREIIEALFGWLANTEDSSRFELFKCTERAVEMIFDTMEQRANLVATFKKIIYALWAAIMLLLTKVFGFDALEGLDFFVAMIFYTSAGLFVLAITRFISGAVLTGWPFWSEKFEEWKQLKLGLSNVVQD